MRLEHLCDMELVYQQTTLLDDKFVLVQPYGGQEGTGYGEGDGIVTGERLTGTLRWVNQPHRRSDSTMLPNVHGIIRTRDDAQRYLDELAIQGYKGYMVFGLLASWDKDTRKSAENWWKCQGTWSWMQKALKPTATELPAQVTSVAPARRLSASGFAGWL